MFFQCPHCKTEGRMTLAPVISEPEWRARFTPHAPKGKPPQVVCSNCYKWGKRDYFGAHHDHVIEALPHLASGEAQAFCKTCNCRIVKKVGGRGVFVTAGPLASAKRWLAKFF